MREYWKSAFIFTSLCLLKLPNASLERGCFPNKLKLAEVIPVFKKEDELSKENYLPVRVLFHVSKIFERVVFNPFLANVPILYPLKTPENFWFSGIFRGYKIGTLARNGLAKWFFFKSKFSLLLTGFCKNHSTQNALLNRIEKWKHALDKKQNVW